ncbi:ceramide glucosyltransferase [Cryptococcus wingfieldii CBS 7118]|uniref:Ceramide glucosyltransferase n=1 Tax=Cryptococcus wingfieldii CBS 7118 TaxID=1295528 RepID=A0A1E3JZP7_9TREE|nr:ceramide glucosyltransferase [Cryptococcus wingfieldii CBS 7118]ODO06255.1 ceramide glucosyltransferase [Cryptococcus wingfieldii CBS 7118]
MGASIWGAIGLSAFYTVVWALNILGWRTARIRYAHPNLPSRLSQRSPSATPGVTIIRPLCGLDQNLYNTLESVMKIQYPKFEVIFALQSEQDEALPVVRMIMEKYPDVDARVVINSIVVGVNPKVNNLMTPFRDATYDLLWVLDSTCSVVPDTLGRSIEAFFSNPISNSPLTTYDPEASPLLSIADDVRKPPVAGEVGLVHQVPLAVCYQKTWGSLIEQAYLNTTHSKMYLAINAVSIDSCVVGKSCIYSRDNISNLTSPAPSLRTLSNSPKGLEGFGPYLAEDNMIGLSLWHELKLKHAMTSDVVLDFLGALTVTDYINRRVRWLRVRKKMTPIVVTLLEPATESIVAGLYGSWAISTLLDGNMFPIFLVHMAIWLGIDLSTKAALETNVKHIGPPGSRVTFLMAWAARECLALPIWLMSMTSADVVWRGNKYRIVDSGKSWIFHRTIC